MIGVFYHSPCHDGTASAYAALLALGREVATYHPIQYGEEITPEWLEPGEDLIFLDWSPGKDGVRRACAQASTVLVIDHHQTAIDALRGLDQECRNLTLVLNPHRSAAALTWYWFHQEPLPKLIELIEDRDTWRNSDPRSRPLHYALSLLPARPEDWHAHFEDTPDLHLDELLARGQAITAYQDLAIERAAAHPEESIGYIEGYEVPLLNLPHTAVSDVLHTILADDVARRWPFAASYYDDHRRGQRVYSLRSTDERADVAAIAQRFGGGGHRNAAGFRLRLRLDDLLANSTAFDEIGGQDEEESE